MDIIKKISKLKSNRDADAFSNIINPISVSCKEKRNADAFHQIHENELNKYASRNTEGFSEIWNAFRHSP